MGTISTPAPKSATTFTTPNDVAIIEANERRLAAYAEMERLAPTSIGNVSGAENEQWSIIDAAELVIMSSVATTPRGAEVQLWTALHNHYQEAEPAAAANRADLDWFDAKHDDLDWPDKLFVATIRSLRAMSLAAEKGGAA